jgi:hypothetical protein
MYCINCGAKNLEEARFCARCGHALSAVDTAPPSGASAPVSLQSTPLRRPLPLLPITIGIVIVALLLGGVYVGIFLLGDSPEKAAQEWVQAFANLDGNKIAERTCAAQQANVQQAGLLNSVVGLFGQQTIGQQANTDVSGLKFTTVSRSSNIAAVRVTGQIRVAVLGLSQTQDINETWSIARENGKWKWCGQTRASIPSTPSTTALDATFLGQDGGNFAGQLCTTGTTNDNIHIHLTGLRTDRPVSIRVDDPAGGVWSTPCDPVSNWQLYFTSNVSNQADIYFKPFRDAPDGTEYTIVVQYSDGGTQTTSVIGRRVKP